MTSKRRGLEIYLNVTLLLREMEYENNINLLKSDKIKKIFVFKSPSLYKRGIRVSSH
jgi:hypothetical protein